MIPPNLRPRDPVTRQLPTLLVLALLSLSTPAQADLPLATSLRSVAPIDSEERAQDREPDEARDDAPQETPPPPKSRFEEAIRAFEREDERKPPPRGAILFLGSSSIRLWKLDRSFPDLDAINRGFGGSEISDSIEHASRIVLPYRPRTIVFYAGDNDIAAGKTPERVAADFKRLVDIVHADLPETRIVYISIKPSIARWQLVDAMRDANRRIEKLCAADERLLFVDIDRPMLGEDGRPRRELLVDDGLHLSEKGYELWTKKVSEALEKIREAEARKSKPDRPESERDRGETSEENETRKGPD